MSNPNHERALNTLKALFHEGKNGITRQDLYMRMYHDAPGVSFVDIEDFRMWDLKRALEDEGYKLDIGHADEGHPLYQL